MPYQDVFHWLVNIGLLEVILPFMLVFIIFFGMLQKTLVFGVEGKKKLPKSKLNALVSFVFGFFAESTLENLTDPSNFLTFRIKLFTSHNLLHI